MAINININPYIQFHGCLLVCYLAAKFIYMVSYCPFTIVLSYLFYFSIEKNRNTVKNLSASVLESVYNTLANVAFLLRSYCCIAFIYQNLLKIRLCNVCHNFKSNN